MENIEVLRIGFLASHLTIFSLKLLLSTVIVIHTYFKKHVGILNTFKSQLNLFEKNEKLPLKTNKLQKLSSIFTWNSTSKTFDGLSLSKRLYGPPFQIPAHI